MINVVFIPNATQGVKNANLNVTAVSGATQTVSLTARDTGATISVSPITRPGALTPTPASTVPVSGTGTFALGGTCAVGTPVNPQTNCTITVTFRPPAGRR